MSISTSLFTGSSGLDAHGSAIGVVGDNIANASTVGFKAERAGFSDVLGGTAPDGQRMGQGVRFGGVESLMGQGSFQSTGRNLDLAINGNGMYIVHGNHNGVSTDYYTRDGRFTVDKTGYLVDTQGLRLQGYNIDSNGATATKTTDLQIGVQSAPKATTTANVGVNLDSTAVVPPAFSLANAAGTSNYNTSLTVFDSLGASHRVDMYFRNQGGGKWEWHSAVDGGEITGGTKGTPVEIGSGTMSFNSNGALQTSATAVSSANFLNATAGQNITWNMGDPIAAGGTGLAGVTQFASASNVQSVNADGYSAGKLADVQIAEDGTITGVFDNGQQRPVARLALATFQNEQGLHRAGSQLFTRSNGSGEALVAAAGSGGRGGIQSGQLEASNVDIGSELVQLIAYQRAFQANSKTVTTADEMLQEIVNLKR